MRRCLAHIECMMNLLGKFNREKKIQYYGIVRKEDALFSSCRVMCTLSIILPSLNIYILLFNVERSFYPITGQGKKETGTFLVAEAHTFTDQLKFPSFICSSKQRKSLKIGLFANPLTERK